LGFRDFSNAGHRLKFGHGAILGFWNTASILPTAAEDRASRR